MRTVSNHFQHDVSINYAIEKHLNGSANTVPIPCQYRARCKTHEKMNTNLIMIDDKTTKYALTLHIKSAKIHKLKK